MYEAGIPLKAVKDRDISLVMKLPLISCAVNRALFFGDFEWISLYFSLINLLIACGKLYGSS